MRKFLLALCIVVSLVLFIDGALIIKNLNTAPRNVPKAPGGNEQTQVERTDEGQSSSAVSPVNLLVLGLDEEEVRSDVIVLLNFDPNSGRVNILSIARDTRVRVRGRVEKINALVGIGKEALAVKGVEQLTGMNIHYYLTLNFKGFRTLVDTLDGVWMNIPMDMDYDDPEQGLHIHLKKGEQVLDGRKAEQFVRYRKGNRSGQGYSDGDIGRIKAQQEFIRNLIDQKLRLKYISKADDIYFILKRNMRTNIEIGDVNYYLRGIRNISRDKVKTFTVPGESSYINDVWYFICDKKKTKKMIDENFYR